MTTEATPGALGSNEGFGCNAQMPARERPILFSAPMVRAILAGTKTQTRRIVKGAPDDWAPIGPEAFSPTVMDRRGDEQPGPDSYGAGNDDGTDWIRCIHGQPGDRLWVRETWGYRCSSGTQAAGQYMHTIAYRADDARHTYGPMPMEGVGLPKWTERKEGQSYESWDDAMNRYWRQWRPSIFMPRWASRITLEVTDVRVERLNDINRGDAMDEGCPFPNMAQGDDPRQWYAELWDQINGPGAWAANPWVWAVEFSCRMDLQPNVGAKAPT